MEAGERGDVFVQRAPKTDFEGRGIDAALDLAWTGTVMEVTWRWWHTVCVRNPDMARRPARILVVDDDPAILALLASAVAEEGFTVDAAATGRAALALALVHRPDAIVTDVEMPGLDGAGLLRELAAQGLAGIPTIVISAGECPDALRGRHFLGKPFDVDVLLGMLPAVLEERAA